MSGIFNTDDFVSGGITLPDGSVFDPGDTDNIMEATKAAARSVGLTRFRLKINGTYIDSEEDLPAENLSELTAELGIEQVGIAVSRYDKAGSFVA